MLFFFCPAAQMSSSIPIKHPPFKSHGKEQKKGLYMYNKKTKAMGGGGQYRDAIFLFIQTRKVKKKKLINSRKIYIYICAKKNNKLKIQFYTTTKKSIHSFIRSCYLRLNGISCGAGW